MATIIKSAEREFEGNPNRIEKMETKTKKEVREEALHITSGLAKLGCKVIARTSASRLTVSDNPNFGVSFNRL